MFESGATIDKREVVRHLGAVAHRYRVLSVAYDRWGMAEFLRLCEEEGVYLETEPFGQGFASMSPAVSALETAILQRDLRHPSIPVLNWAMGNLVVDVDPSGNRKFTKAKSHDKIDPAIALTMALGVATQTVAHQYDFGSALVVI